MENITAETWRTYATMCRLCLQKDGFMLGIFNNIQGKDKSIYKKIIDCTALQVSHGDGLPNVICHRCLFKIEFCLDFRQLCFMSDATLRQIQGVANKDSGTNSNGSTDQNQVNFEQLSVVPDENVVMVVDPNALDFDSEYETDNERQSENENTENTENNFEMRYVTMCKYCDQAFTNKAECTEHELNIHNHDVPYNCSKCDMGFADRLQYSAHLKSVHQNDKPYNCPECDRTFARRSDLRKHTVVHTGVKPFTCHVCFKSFSRNTNLSKHLRIHSGQKPFVCPKCPKTFFSKGDLTRHAIIHSGQKPFNCNFCHLSFGRKDKLLRHERRHLPRMNTKDKSQELQMLRENIMNDYNYGPPVPTDNNLENTTEENQDGWISSENMVINLDPFSNYNNTDIIKSENPSESEPMNGDDLPSIPDHLIQTNDITDVLDIKPELPPVPAHITGESFNNTSDVIEEKNEVEPKKYACPTCNKTFSNPDSIRYHQKCHSNIRPHCCSICSKSFVRKRELDRHLTTHSGMKPFKCTKCVKSFGRKDKLVRHMRIHDITREHICNVCEASFNRRDSLVLHMRTHNREIPRPENNEQITS